MGRWRTVLAWALVAPFLMWTVLRLSGIDAGFRWIQLVSFTPYVAGAAFAVPVAALLLRRRVPAVAGLAVAVVLGGLVLPRLLEEGQPEAKGPVLRVLSANIRFGLTPPDRLLGLARELRADVLSVQELPPGTRQKLEEKGILDLFPHTANGTHDTTLYSRHPFQARVAPAGAVRAVLDVPGSAQRTEFMAVHTCAPLHPGLGRCWRAAQAELPAATPEGELRILAGDFNATLDHASLRGLLSTGYRDAAEVRGAGLHATWPTAGWSTPGIVIDHVFADRRIAVLDYSVHDLPGSDHRAVYAELRLP
ncbi:endonuclease/exonuclease/phosphatase family protein [Actinocorallia populi]|uniref:endonuclease/exonuclease/phosphatase family protein n=1 Tax=Actinocorallia populi TaxID=2079200 RepID=UPI001300AD17|nr:endonuclease/exonuclease/phosphatase family protein [Actinocorallia populi]